MTKFERIFQEEELGVMKRVIKHFVFVSKQNISLEYNFSINSSKTIVYI